MKLPLLLFLQLLLLQSVFSQDITPPRPPKPSPEEISEIESKKKTYQIQNVIKGSTLLHSNRFFSLHCKNKGELNDYKGYIWMLNAKEIFNKTEHTFYDGKQPGVAIFGFEKQFYAKKSSQQELKYFGYNETFDSWNLEKIGEYYFTYSPMKFPLPSNGNLKKANSIKKSKLKIDGVDFIKYEFTIKIGEVELIESSYLTVIDNFVFIIHQRRYSNDKEDIIKTFKRKK